MAIEQDSNGRSLNKIQMEGIEQAVYGTGVYILTVFNITKARERKLTGLAGWPSS